MPSRSQVRSDHFVRVAGGGGGGGGGGHRRESNAPVFFPDDRRRRGKRGLKSVYYNLLKVAQRGLDIPVFGILLSLHQKR